MHRTLEERCIAAQKMASSVDLSGFHVTVDTMLNGANIAYGAIPIRLYIVQIKESLTKAALDRCSTECTKSRNGCKSIAKN